jgi:hypothetical protein
MHKETSSRVSTIAARLVHLTGDAVCVLVHQHDAGPGAAAVNADNSPTLATFVSDVRTLAASCMSQDETPGTDKPKGDFYSRLKDEREDLDRRLGALNSALTHNPGHPNARHFALLEMQSKRMTDLLAVLDERIADIEITRRRTEEAENDGA